MHPPPGPPSPRVDAGEDTWTDPADAPSPGVVGRPAGGGRIDAPATPGRGGGRRSWGVVALAAYTALVAVVLLWPSPVDSGAHDDIAASLAALHAWGVPAWVDYAVVESAANVAMFVPLGFLVAHLTGSPWWGVVAPVALSAAAELSQHLVRPERFATWADVAANTVGATLGVVAAVLVSGPGTPGSRASRHPRPRSRRRSG